MTPADAQYNLAYMYAHGRGVVQDYAEAVRWYRKAADQGDAGAQNHLGIMYAYTFGPHCYRKKGQRYMGASPSKKSVARVKQKVGDLLVPSNTGPWAEVRERLNQILRGWSVYFSYGTRTQAYRAVDNYVYERARHFLRRRHKVQSRGTTRFTDEVVFGELGVLRLRRVQLEPRS